MSTEFKVTLRDGSTLHIRADRCVESGDSFRFVNVPYGEESQLELVALFNVQEVTSILDRSRVDDDDAKRRRY